MRCYSCASRYIFILMGERERERGGGERERQRERERERLHMYVRARTHIYTDGYTHSLTLSLSLTTYIHTQQLHGSAARARISAIMRCPDSAIPTSTETRTGTRTRTRTHAGHLLATLFHFGRCIHRAGHVDHEDNVHGHNRRAFRRHYANFSRNS